MKGGFRTQVYLQETYRDAHERSGSKWECGISYSTSIVVLGSLKTTGGWFQQIETDVDFVISGVSSIFNDN